MKPKNIQMPGTIKVAFCALATLCAATSTSSAQLTKFGKLNVVQNDAGNVATSVTVTLGAGSTGGIVIPAGSNRGDYNLNFGPGNDPTVGVLITSVSQLSRNNDAFGDTVGTFYANSMASDATNADYFIPIHNAPTGDEANINTSFAFFPYNKWIGGIARNAPTNNGAMTTLLGTTGLDLNTGGEFNDPTATAGIYTLNINSFTANGFTTSATASQSGILLVTGGKNEDNYALSKANTDGTFTIYCHDNGDNSTTYENDPVNFVYLPTSQVGTKNLLAMGRIRSNATTATGTAGGTYTVTKGTGTAATGVWYLTIPNQTDSTGTLIISPEGGATNNVDNIVSYEWDATNSRWIIESRDLPTPATGLQNGSTGTEDMFSFAFFAAPPTAYASSGFTGAPGATIADADLGTTGNQPAVLGTSAFSTISAALTNSGSLAPFILNGGTYAEAVDLTDEFSIEVTGPDLAQTVSIGSLAGLPGSTFVIEGASQVELGSNNGTTVYGGLLTGGTNSVLTKSGTGQLSLTNANSGFTGTVVVNGGTLLVDDLGAGGDLNAKQITVNNGGVFIFGPTNNADFPDSTNLTINTGGRFELQQGENYGQIVLNGGEFRFVSTSRTNVNNSAISTTAGAVAYDLRNGSITANLTGGGTGGALNTGTGNGLGILTKTTSGTVTFGPGVSVSSALEMQIKEGTLALQGSAISSGANLLLGDTLSSATLRAEGTTSVVISRPIISGALGAQVEVVDPAGRLEMVGNVSGVGALTLAGSGKVYLAPTTLPQTVSVPLAGSTELIKWASGTTTLSGVNPYSGTLSVNEGVLSLTGSLAGNVTVDDFGVLAGEGSIGGNLTLGTVTGGNLSVDASTSQTLEVTGSVTLTGSTIVTLAGSPATTGTVAIPVIGYGTLSGDPATGLQLANAAFYRPGSGVFSDDAVNSQILMSLVTKSLTWKGDSAFWDAATSSNWQSDAPDQFFFGDSVTFDDTATSAVVDLVGQLTPGRIVVDSDVNQFVISDTSGGSISGPGSLLKMGTSTLVMDATNTFTGGTVISEGSIDIRDVAALGTGSVTLGDINTGAGNVALYLDTDRINFPNAIQIPAAGTGTATLGSRATVTSSGDNNQFTSVNLGRSVIFDSNAADRTDYENITGAGSITVTGVGRTVFPTTPALWTGDVRVSTTGAGSFQIGVGSTAGNRIPDSSNVTVDAGAVLRLSATSETIAGLNGAGLVSTNSPSGGTGTLSVGSSDASGNFSGVLEGSAASNILALTKVGSGTQILSGNSTYSGATTVNGGTLQIGNGTGSGDLGAGTITVAAGATLEYNRTGAVIQEGALNSSGTVGASNLKLSGDGTTQLTLALAGNFNGLITLQAGTLVFGVTNAVGQGTSAPAFNLAPATTVTNTPDVTHTHLGALQLAGGSLLTTSSGTSNYNGENYQLNGDVTVSGGAAAAVISREATRTNADSGLSLRGTRTFTVADVTASAAADLVISTELEPSDNNTAANLGALTKSGPGTLQLAGGIAHSYTGATTVQQGTLLASGSIIGSLEIQSGGTIAPGASAGTFAAASTTIDGTYACEIDGAQVDLLQVTGDLTLGASSSLVVSSIGAAPTGSTYVIASYTGTRTGAFINVSGLPAGYSVVYNDAGKQIELAYTAVDPFAGWLTSKDLTGAAATADSDGDGIANILEFVVGGEPSGPGSNSSGLLPTVSVDGTYLLFTFRRTNESAYLLPYVEYGSTLAGWTKAQDGTNGVIITVTDDGFGAGVDSVLVKIPRTLATSPAFFARLGVQVP